MAASLSSSPSSYHEADDAVTVAFMKWAKEKGIRLPKLVVGTSSNGRGVFATSNIAVNERFAACPVKWIVSIGAAKKSEVCYKYLPILPTFDPFHMYRLVLQ
jgi:hypothetical protein